jgi:hypothetical protein
MADELVIEFKVNEKDSLNKTTKILDAIKGLDIAIKLTTKSFSFLWDTAAGSVNTTLSTLSTGYQQLQKTMDSGALAASTLIDSLDKSRENAEALKKAGTELAVLKAIFLGMAGALAIALSVPVSSTVGVAIGISFLVNAFWELGKAIFDATEKQKQWAKEVDEATRLAHRRLEEFWKYAGVWGEGPGLFPESEQVIRPLEETLEIMRKIEDGNFGEYLAVQWSKYTEAIKFSNERLIDHRDLLKVTRMLEGHAPEKEKGGGFSIPSPNPFDEGQRSSVRLIPPGGNRSGNAAAIDNSVLDTQLAKIQALKELNDIYAVSLDMVFNKNELVYMSFKQGNPILSTVEQRQRDLVASNESLSQSEEEVLLTVPKATQAFDIHKATMDALEKQKSTTSTLKNLARSMGFSLRNI